MNRKKLTLKDLKVSSFITTLNNTNINELKGGTGDNDDYSIFFDCDDRDGDDDDELGTEERNGTIPWVCDWFTV